MVAVGSHQGRLDELEVEIPGVVGERADLTDGDDVLELAMRVHARLGDVDGLVHLVGGWRGGGGIAGQTEEDYRFLEQSFTALRHVSRVFFDDLVHSDAGRIAIDMKYAQGQSLVALGAFCALTGIVSPGALAEGLAQLLPPYRHQTIPINVECLAAGARAIEGRAGSVAAWPSGNGASGGH